MILYSSTKEVSSFAQDHEKAVKRHETGVSLLHLKAKCGLAGRKRKKLLGKTSWFKRKTREEAEENVGRVRIKRSTTNKTILLQTRGGALATKLKEKKASLSLLAG